MRGFLIVPTVAAFAVAASATASVSTRIALNSSPNVKPGDTFVVTVDLADAVGAVGAQLRVNFDPSKVVLDSIDAGDDFPLMIYSNASAPGTATFATGVFGGSSGIVSGNIAKLTFHSNALLCADDIGAAIASSGFNNRLTNASGQQLVFGTGASVAVNVLGTFSISGTPGSVSGKACDAGALSAVVAAVSGAAPAASDSCGTALNVFLSVNGTPGPMPASFPIGTTTLSWTATDAAGNTDTTTASVQVDDRQVMTVYAGLDGVAAGQSNRSTLNLAYSGGSVGGQGVTMAFVPGIGGTAAGHTDIDIVPALAAVPACVSLKDTAHSLRNTGTVSTSGTKYTTNIGLTQGDSNDDDLVDILDFGIYVGDYGSGKLAADRSNFNGDAAVDTADFTFISSNFFQIGSGCSAFWHNQPRATVTVKDLRRMGMGDLAIADVNGDGRVDSRDVALFLQGYRQGTAVKGTAATTTKSAPVKAAE